MWETENKWNTETDIFPPKSNSHFQEYLTVFEKQEI